jgi:hypothetical protein
MQPLYIDDNNDNDSAMTAAAAAAAVCCCNPLDAGLHATLGHMHTHATYGSLHSMWCMCSVCPVPFFYLCDLILAGFELSYALAGRKLAFNWLS